MKKQIAILGSTGSIGKQTLEVISEHQEMFEISVLTANNNADLLIKQAIEFLPDSVVIANTEKYSYVKDALDKYPIKVFAGNKSIAQIVENENIDIVVTAMVGYSGLEPTMNAIKAGKTIALANKETLVVAGDIINELAYKHKSAILPVDSEHSAIFQCLAGEINNPIEKIILTASGGPFRKFKSEDLINVKASDALKHPNWEMGAKITIDSATLMNKGFEAIEAKWLFGLKPDQIEVVVHPQSIIHSMVQFQDASVKAQLGMPDMKLPIAYALSYPNRMKSNINKRMELKDYSNLTFEEPDMNKFPNLKIAFDAMYLGGNAACIVNAANEIVVDAFLKGQCGFIQMSDIINSTLGKTQFIAKPSYEDYVETDKMARIYAKELLF